MMLEAARFHLALVICTRFPPGAERHAWLAWLQSAQCSRMTAKASPHSRSNSQHAAPNAGRSQRRQ
jgi:hypothetical protein